MKKFHDNDHVFSKDWKKALGTDYGLVTKKKLNMPADLTAIDATIQREIQRLTFVLENARDKKESLNASMRQLIKYANEAEAKKRNLGDTKADKVEKKKLEKSLKDMKMKLKDLSKEHEAAKTQFKTKESEATQGSELLNKSKEKKRKRMNQKPKAVSWDELCRRIQNPLGLDFRGDVACKYCAQAVQRIRQV